MLKAQRRVSAGALCAVVLLAAAALASVAPALSQEKPAAPTLELRYKPELDREQLYRIKVDGPGSATFDDGTALANAQVKLSGDLTAMVSQIKGETFVITLAIANPKVDIGGIQMPVQDVGESRPSVELTRLGKVVSTDFEQSLLGPMQIHGLDAALLPALLSALQLPEQPVAVGATWESEMRTGEGGTELVATAKSTLTAVAEHAAKITSNATVQLPPLEMTVMEFPLQVRSGTVTLEKLLLDFDTQLGAPVRAEGMLRVSLRSVFQQMPLNIKADLKVKVGPPEPPQPTPG